MARKGDKTKDGALRVGTAFSVAKAVTPSDTTDLPFGESDSLYVGGAGTVVATINGEDLSFVAVPAGSTLNIAATRVKQASTATAIIALYLGKK